MSQSIKIIKRRIKSAVNISQVTKAMQMVASSKMRQAKKKMEQNRSYSEKISFVTKSLMQEIPISKKIIHPLLKKPAKNLHPLFVLITTNKGLCANLNINIFKTFKAFYLKFAQRPARTFDFLTLGLKGTDFILSLKGRYLADFSDAKQFNKIIPSLTLTIKNQFISGKNTSVYLVYNQYINALKQEPIIKKILPLGDFDKEKMNSKHSFTEGKDLLIEPKPEIALKTILSLYLKSQIREAVFQAEASEYAARMMAMKNATDNALALKDALTLKYNKIRQQTITNEINDITTAKISMEANE